LFLGEAASKDVAAEYKMFLEAYQEGTLPVAPFADNKAIAFWRELRSTGQYPLIVRYALKALSIPYSNATVERTFSVMKGLEHKNRLSAGEDYLKNLMLHNCNRPWLAAMHQETCKDIMPSEPASLMNFFEA
jgi:hypothetical protein